MTTVTNGVAERERLNGDCRFGFWNSAKGRGKEKQVVAIANIHPASPPPQGMSFQCISRLVVDPFVYVGEIWIVWKWENGWMDHSTFGCRKLRTLRWRSIFLLLSSRSPMGLKEYQVLGRHLPTANDATPKIYRMRIFAPNEVVAKSRFWYFLRWVWNGIAKGISEADGFVRKLKKVKAANGEIVGVNQVSWLSSLSQQSSVF